MQSCADFDVRVTHMDVTFFTLNACLIMSFEGSQFNSLESQLSVARAGVAIFKGWVGAAKPFLNEEAIFGATFVF